MRTLIRLGVSCATVGLATNALADTTIYSTVDSNNPGYGISTLWDTSWSQTNSFSNVSIAAAIDGGDGTTFGTFYLTTRIGPGTTPSDEVAEASYSVTGPRFHPQLVTLFSGLTLGPGTYHLIMMGSATGGWEQSSQGLVPVMAPGVATVDRGGYCYSPVAAYPPATSFAPNTLLSYFQYSVIAVPEPDAPSLGILLAGTLLFSRVLRFKQNQLSVPKPCGSTLPQNVRGFNRCWRIKP